MRTGLLAGPHFFSWEAVTRPLFRPQAVAAQSQQWLGRVQVSQPLSVSLMTAGVVAIALALALFLGLAHYTRKATVPGVLAPDRGLIRVVPAAGGTVLERHAAEGQAVRAGDVLFVLGVERTTLEAGTRTQVARSIEQRQRSLEEAARRQATLLGARETALARRLEALALERAQAEAEGALQQQRLALAQQALARLESLRGEQFISDAQVQAKREEVLGLQAAAQALERQRAALGRERAELEGELQQLPLLARGEQGDIERDLAALSREAAEVDAAQRLVVRAPQDGTLTAVVADTGQSVAPSSALASLVPAGAQLQAQLYAPSSAIGFVRPGQAVRLRYEAFPYAKFGHRDGQVLEVSRTPLAPAELGALALTAGGPAREALFRITVALQPGGAPLPLVAGMRLEADLLLERRRLAEWMFAPLLGLRERL